MAKATWIKVGGIWKDCVSIWRNVSGSWQPEIIPWIRTGGVWKDCYDMSRLTPSYLDVEDGGFTITNLGMNLSLGTISFNDATYGFSLDNLTVQVRVFNWKNEEQCTPIVYYNGPYTANASLGAMSNVVYGPPIPSVGFWCRIEFLESS